MKSISVVLWTSFAVGAVLSVIAQVHSQDNSSAIPVVIRRRPSLDSYTILQANKSEDVVCDVNNATYLVKENQCINNRYLFNECSFVITPTGEFNTSRLHLNIEMAGTATTAQTTNVIDDVVDAVVALRGIAEHTQLNSSICHISSLEVYRGREQAIEISHGGFSLSSNGTIKVDSNQLDYSSDNYVGELYRMNLSCSGGGLPGRGCLFFKVGGPTDIQEAKFNCSVPGTLPTNSSECSSTADDTTTTPISDTQETTTLRLTPTSNSIQTMTDSTTSVESPPNVIEIGSPLFYGIVGAGATVIVLTLFCMICICIMLGCRRECKCGPKVGATNKGQPAPYEDIEIRGMKTQGYNPSFQTDSIGPYNIAEQDLENKYAEIGATYQEVSPRVRNPKQPAWARTSSAVTNAGSEQPPQEYSTLVQVGGHALRNNLANSLSDINSEQYAQLMISK